VRFVKNDILMTGDYFRSIQYPNIDRANGGTLQGMLDGLAQTIALCSANTKVIPGHGAIVDRAALVAHRDMIIAIRDKVAPLVRQGRTLEQVIAAKPTADFDAKVPMVGATGDRFIGQLYAELQAAK
jgi:cyclase